MHKSFPYIQAALCFATNETQALLLSLAIENLATDAPAPVAVSGAPAVAPAPLEVGARASDQDALRVALEDERWTWRTIGALAKAIGKSERDTRATLERMPGVRRAGNTPTELWGLEVRN